MDESEDNELSPLSFGSLQKTQTAGRIKWHVVDEGAVVRYYVVRVIFVRLSMSLEEVEK